MHCDLEQGSASGLRTRSADITSEPVRNANWWHGPQLNLANQNHWEQPRKLCFLINYFLRTLKVENYWSKNTKYLYTASSHSYPTSDPCLPLSPSLFVTPASSTAQQTLDVTGALPRPQLLLPLLAVLPHWQCGVFHIATPSTILVHR